jgi:PAS domain S-box-containing protein
VEEFVSGPASHSLNFFAFPPLVVGILVALLGILTVLWERFSRISLLFCLLTFSASLWLTSYGIVFLIPDPEMALAVSRWTHVGVSVIPSLLYMFVLAMGRPPVRYQLLLPPMVALSFYFCYLALRSDVWLSGIHHYFWGYYPLYGSHAPYFFTFFFTSLFGGLAVLGLCYRSAGSKRAKYRLRTMLWAIALGSLACVDFLANMGLNIYPVGYLPILFFILLSSNTMLRYHLVDLTPAFAAGQILETMESAVIVLDHDGIIRVANRAVCEMLKYKRNEIIGLPSSAIFKYTTTSGLGKVAGLMDPSLSKGGEAFDIVKIRSYPMQWAAKDGQLVQVSISASVLKNSKGLREGTIYVAEDLTERQRTEKALEQTEDQFRLVMNSVDEYAITMLDPEGSVTSWSAGGEKLKGYKADEVLGKPFFMFYLPEDVSDQRPQRLLKSAAAQGFVEDEGWIRRKNGSKFWARVTMTALRNKAGKLEGFLRVTRDRTQSKEVDDKLRESEERFRSVAESANEAIVCADEKGYIMYWNNGASSIFGYADYEVIGRPLSIIMPQRYREAHERGLYRLRHTGELKVMGKTLELHGLRKDGTEFPIELSLSHWKTSRGLFFAGIIRDISLRRQMQEERERFFTVSLEMLCVVNYDGYFKQLNPTWQKVTGWSNEELMARPALEFVHPEDRTESEIELRKVVSGLNVESYEHRFLCKDGTYRWLLWNAIPLPDQKLIYGAARDITESRKNKEMRLRLASIVESTNDAILGMNRTGTITSWNPAAEKIFGYKAVEIIGSPVAILALPEDAGEVAGIISRIQEGGTFENYEAIRLRKDGTPIKVALTISPIRDATGRITGISTVCRDITALKEAEDLLRHKKDLEMKSQFISVVSHELRTPLTAIKMGGDVLMSGRSGDVTEEQKEWLDMICRNVDRLARLINNVLDFQKLDAGRVVYEKKKHNLNELVLEIEKTVHPLFKDKPVALKLELAGDLPEADFDRDKVAQVLINLVDNAAKFTDQGAVTIKTAKKGNTIELAVHDTGIGIKKENLGKLFTSFSQVHDPSTNRKVHGTGLGLAISKRIVEQHGGRIWVQSEFGKGSTFGLILPVEAGEAAAV